MAHLDIKPENTLLAMDKSKGNYVVKLADFGVRYEATMAEA
eukprot:COSAG06_NODE_46950_length_343_cov_0.622951_1_plen_40_part_10